LALGSPTTGLVLEREPRLADRHLLRETFTVIGHAIEPLGAEASARRGHGARRRLDASRSADTVQTRLKEAVRR
jgi:hypothetical protein